jgi:hypothetical protein
MTDVNVHKNNQKRFRDGNQRVWILNLLELVSNSKIYSASWPHLPCSGLEAVLRTPNASSIYCYFKPKESNLKSIRSSLINSTVDEQA